MPESLKVDRYISRTRIILDTQHCLNGRRRSCTSRQQDPETDTVEDESC